MKCPHCRKELIMDQNLFKEAKILQKVIMANTECCNSKVQIEPKFTFKITDIKLNKK